jgi:hypothetical protein
MRPDTTRPHRPPVGPTVRRRTAVLAAAVALLAASVPAVFPPPASAVAPELIVDVSFGEVSIGGNFTNSAPQNGGTAAAFGACPEEDPGVVAGPCNSSSELGTDEVLGTFWQWGADRAPGGGLSLTTTATIGSSDAYTLAIRFSFDEIDDQSYFKIVDYSGYGNAETGFYVGFGRRVVFDPIGTSSDPLMSSGEVVDLVVVRSIESRTSCDPEDTGVGEAPCLTAYLVTSEGLVLFLRAIDGFDASTPAAAEGGGSLFGLFHDDKQLGGIDYAPSGRVYSVRLWNGALSESAVLMAVGLGGSVETTDEGGDQVGSGPMLIGGVLPSLPRGGGELVRPDGTVVTAVVTPSGGGTLRYEFDGITLDLTGGPQTTTSGGLVVGASGEIALEISAPLVSGGVIEAWMFSEPRLVGAVRVGDQPSQRFVIPVGAPLDGRGPVPAGPHTLQLQLPTAAGMQAVHVGLTVGGPVPTGVPAGESPGVPAGPLAVTVALALVASMVVRRRAVDLVG